MYISIFISYNDAITKEKKTQNDTQAQPQQKSTTLKHT